MSRKRRVFPKRKSKTSLTYRGQVYKSGLEVAVAKRLHTLGISQIYERIKIPYILSKKYNPDFEVEGTEIILEAKGLLRAADRTKMLAVKVQHPELDIRFVFQKPHQRCSGIKMTHAEWAEKNGFLWYSVDQLGKRVLK